MKQDALIKRPIPSTGEEIPVVGLGTWQTFDKVASDIISASRLMKSFIDSRGTLVDSSPMYGVAESVVGKSAEHLGITDSLFIATKVWTTGKEQGIRQMETSLQLFKRSMIDLMQIHNLQDWQTHLKTINDWKDLGKIRYTGITHYTDSTHSRMKQIIKENKIDFIQINCSILSRNAEKELIPFAADRGVAVIINRPFEERMLFSKLLGKPLPDWRAEIGCTNWSEFLLKYLIGNPAVTCIIPASSNPRHIADNMAAIGGNIPDEKTRQKMIAYVESL